MAQPVEKMHCFRTVLKVERHPVKVESWISKELVCSFLTSATTRIVWCVNEMFEIMLF